MAVSREAVLPLFLLLLPSCLCLDQAGAGIGREVRVIRVDPLHNHHQRQQVDGAQVEYPLPFEIPLPAECTVAGTNTRSYNQGQCSRRSCQTPAGECHESWQCCFEVAQTSVVTLSCNNSSSLLKGNAIVTCKCQPCSKLQAQIKGVVLSSLNGRPVVLTAILMGSEIATFTNQEGKFFFELRTSDREVTLLFQEARHRQLEITLNVHPSVRHELTITLEYVQTVNAIDRMQDPFSVQLSSNAVISYHGINTSFQFASELLVDEATNEIYSGSGQVLHSLYHANTPPTFSMPAIHNMVYTDSRNTDFTIQAYVIGTMKVIGENGQPLALRPGNALPLSLSIKFDTEINNFANLHLFAYSTSQSRWLDHGRMYQAKLRPIPSELGTWVDLVGTLRELNQLWAVGFPSRATCYVKVKAFHVQSNNELTGLSINLQQNDDRFGRMTFYQQTTETGTGTGVCLKSVCSYGGIISPIPGSHMVLEAVAPHTDSGIILGKKDQIMFYTADRNHITTDFRTPYYTSEDACRQNHDRGTAYFKFVSYSDLDPPQTPTILPLPSQPLSEEEFCFIKVAVYDCAMFTDVKTLSYAEKHEVLTMNVNIAEPAEGAPLVEACDDSNGIAQLRASCVEFTCGTNVHVTVQSRQQKTKSKDCRYWSSSSAVLWSVPSGHNLTAFHFTDARKQYSLGLFHSTKRELALMKCYSGDSNEPGNSIDPYIGTAVTFTCQF